MDEGADQAWFWSDPWQRMERQVDAHVERGETTSFDSSADFLSSFKDLDDEDFERRCRRSPL